MEDIQTETQLSPEEELIKLQERQEELKKKLDEANQQKTQATLRSISEKAKKREEEEAEERRVLAEISRRKRERQREEEEEQRAREAQAAKERAEREEQLAQEKAERTKREAELERVRSERTKALALEAELRKIETELARGIVISDVSAQETVTVHSPSHPLSKIFGTGDQNTAPAVEVDSVAVANEEAAKRKAQAEKPWTPAKKTQRFVDQTTSADLEKAIRAKFRMSANPTRCDQLSAVWNYADLMKALAIVEERTQGTSVGHDQLFFSLEYVLNEAAQRVEIR